MEKLHCAGCSACWWLDGQPVCKGGCRSFDVQEPLPFTFVRVAPFEWCFNEEKVISIYPALFGYRVTLREAGSYQFDANWCAGHEYKHIRLLLNAMANYVLADVIPPFSSKVKPYFDDPEFCKTISVAMGITCIDFSWETYKLLRETCPVQAPPVSGIRTRIQSWNTL